jgi:hypothetical protein
LPLAEDDNALAFYLLPDKIILPGQIILVRKNQRLNIQPVFTCLPQNIGGNLQAISISYNS